MYEVFMFSIKILKITFNFYQTSSLSVISHVLHCTYNASSLSNSLQVLLVPCLQCTCTFYITNRFSLSIFTAITNIVDTVHVHVLSPNKTALNCKLSSSTSSSRKTSSIKSVEFSLYFTASLIASRKALGQNKWKSKINFRKSKNTLEHIMGVLLLALDRLAFGLSSDPLHWMRTSAKPKEHVHCM